MKRVILGVVAAMLISTPVMAESTGEDASGLGTYSQGYRMGRIVKCSVKGTFTKSTECQINMGKDGDVWAVKGNDGMVQKNPVPFSGSDRAINVLGKYEGKYIWLRYDEAQFKSPTRDTSYTALEVDSVTKQAPACKAQGAKSGSYSEGSRFGRVVKVSIKGTAIKTYEMTMQVGESGKDFYDMSIKDESVYNCAIEWLKSGKPVLVRYTQPMVNISFNDTSYNVFGIEGSDDL